MPMPVILGLLHYVYHRAMARFPQASPGEIFSTPRSIPFDKDSSRHPPRSHFPQSDIFVIDSSEQIIWFIEMFRKWTMLCYHAGKRRGQITCSRNLLGNQKQFIALLLDKRFQKIDCAKQLTKRFLSLNIC
jgi:hypothetical protein